MKKVIITEQQLRKVVSDQRKSPDAYPGIRFTKGIQGLLNKIYKANLTVDGINGPTTSEFLKKYIIERGMKPVGCSEQYCGKGRGSNIVDTTFGGNKQLSSQFLDIMIKDGLKNFVPPVPPGGEKFKFDK